MKKRPTTPNSTIESNEVSIPTNYGDELPSVPSLDNSQSFNAKDVVGAQIDESQIKHTINVNINHLNASNSNFGSKQRPLKTLSSALEKAKEYLRKGEGTKIIIHPGIYREGELVINGQDLEPQGQDALLVIQGSEKGKVIISGSEVWQLNTWDLVQVGDVAYYQHDWHYDFGNHGGPWGKHGPKEVIGHRSEMVFVNGKPLKQVLLENYHYTWPDSFDGTGTHEYIGFNKPEDVLKPNYFGVAELDKNGNKIYIQPENGVDLANSKIEVATKRFIFQFVHKNNVVLRNLNFQHTASSLSVDETGAAVIFGPWWYNDKGFVGSNILIENCDFRWNNSLGLSLQGVKQLTLRHNISNYNGFQGIGSYILKNTIWEDTETSFNNWRGYRSNWTGWAIAGAKLVLVRNGVFRRYQSIGNMTHGLWFDIGNRNILIENLTAVDNIERGLFLEISPGPFKVNQALLAGNQDVNLLIFSAKNIVLENSIIYGINGEDSIQFVSDHSRTFSDKLGEILGENDNREYPIFLGKTELRNNIVGANSQDQDLLVQRWGDPTIYKKFLQQQYSGWRNFYWSRSDKVFGLGVARERMVNIQSWADHTKEVDYQWQNPRFISPKNYNFLLKNNSPLKNRKSSLPIQELSESKIQELKDFKAWVND